MKSSAPIEPQIGCIASALRVIGQKWTALIIRDLCSGPKRFGELEKSVGNINPRTLTQRLEALEAYGVVTKETFAEVPPRTVYTLTDKGHDLIPVLTAMATWGNKHHEEC
jgi:DNA-binding HxlR family transcriptional regulator